MPPPPCEANKIPSQFKERHTHTAEKCECDIDEGENGEMRRVASMMKGDARSLIFDMYIYMYVCVWQLCACYTG